MFHNFGYEVANILKEAEKIRYELKHPYVGTEHLLLAILKNDKNVESICQKYGLTATTFEKELIKKIGKSSKAEKLNLYTPMLKRVLELAVEEASENNNGKVLSIHFILAMLEEGDGVAIRIMDSLNVPLNELYHTLKSKLTKEKRKTHLEITKIGINLTEKSQNLTPLIGRDKEIESIIETLLRKQKNNPLLIGKAGVGKTAIIEELARRIINKEVPKELENMEIYELEMGSLVAGTKYRGEFEERLTKLIKEVIANQKIIIFIDEIHSMVNAGGAEGAICASDILKPYLARGDLKIIGSTTIEEYHEYISKDKALKRRFENILIEEPSSTAMLNILKNIKKDYENHYHIQIKNQNLIDLQNYAEQYIFTKNNPDKTIDLLDSVCAHIKIKYSNILKNHHQKLETVIKKKENYLLNGSYNNALKIAKEEQKLRKNKDIEYPKLTMTKKDIIEVVENKTNINLTTSPKKWQELLTKNLKTNIIGQEKALNTILDTININNFLPTSFLLSGPSGVGKTKTVKIISNTLQTPLLRIDMSEYNLEESINKLIGAPSGYVGYGKDYVFRKLIEQPYQTILFDEVEKAHHKVLQLLLQILDEGFITDSLGNKIYFNHTRIFLTSNILVNNKIGFTNALDNKLDNCFSKELMGRIDAVINYEPITKEIAYQYISLNLKNKDIDIEKLLQEANYEKYGLRNLKNLINKYNKKCLKLSIN